MREREIDFRGDEWKHDNEHSTLVYNTEEQTINGNSVGNIFWGYKFMPKQMNQTDIPLLFTFFFNELSIIESTFWCIDIVLTIIHLYYRRFLFQYNFQ